MVSMNRKSSMSDADDSVRRAALQRIGQIFGVDAASIDLEFQFGTDLLSSFVSDFKRNEFDQVLDDIHDVADDDLERELSSGELVIRTVDDYCRYMIRCYGVRPSDVKHVLRMSR